MPKMTILLTNDDSYRSAGFYPLLEEFSREYSVLAVAPSSERSWLGKSVSVAGVEVERIMLDEFYVHACSGTPADCAQIGLHNMGKKPDIVVSGINLGNNMGRGRILSSGTVGAAMEAAIDGVPAVCSSLCITPETKRSTDFFDPGNRHMFRNAAGITAKVVKIMGEKGFGGGIDLVSVNIPFSATPDTGYEVTRPGREPYGRLFHRRSGQYVHMNPPLPPLDGKGLRNGTDIKALADGKISVTPLSLELVSEDGIRNLENILKKSW